MSERKIGKVISVDSFRVIIQLEDNLKSLFKSGFHDIYEIARINSYVIIPVGADRIVAIVTRVKVQEESEIDRTKGSINLPKAERYLVATMIGTIESGLDSNGGKYLQGVYNFPILDNPVWYVIREDLDTIFDQQAKAKKDYCEDFYLPIGTSPAFSDYQIKINPDRFFGKHAAILGNTGSGKSCTVASIIQSLFAYDYEGKELNSANFVVFDTNGEYKKAFSGSEESPYILKELINPFHIDRDGMKVPYWFMNFADVDYLFEPSPNTQAPILKRAIGLAKNNAAIIDKPILESFVERGILDLLAASPDELKRKKKRNDFGNYIYRADNEVNGLGLSIDSNGDQLLDAIKNTLISLGADITLAQEQVFLTALKQDYANYSSFHQIEQISVDKNIDLPIWFNFNELTSRFFDEAIAEQEGSANRIREFVSTLRLRLQSFLNDERIAGPLILQQENQIQYALARFLAFILGDYHKIFSEGDTDLFSQYHISKKGIEIVEGKVSQITIIDMSLLPNEVLETITGLIGRLILDFVSRFSEIDRGKQPIVIVLEEAQNYIPERNNGDRISIAKKVFERVAREGRKYGLSLLVSSQRPSELSKTVLSQCNSFIIHRLQNPEDQKYVRQLVSAANEDILNQLPILPQQHAVIMGDAVRSPVQVRINTASPRPNSDNPEFINNWIQNKPDFPNYKAVTTCWEAGG